MSKDLLNESMTSVGIGTAKRLIQNKIKVNLKRYANAIETGTLDSFKPAAPVMMHSSAGVGKSAIIGQISQSTTTPAPTVRTSDKEAGKLAKVLHALAENKGIPMVDVRLSTMEQSDLCGIPYVDQATGEMKFSIPSWFPDEDTSPVGILFFDELSNASLGVQQAAYRIILDRELQHNVRLPKGWTIVAAGNLKSDKTGAKQVAPALANRFSSHFDVTASVEDFTAYAAQADIHPEIIGFINTQQEMLHNFDPSANQNAYPTPRTWEFASDHIKYGELNEEDLYTTLVGCIGSEAAIKFQGYKKYFTKLPDFSKIASGKATFDIADVDDDRGLHYAVASSLIHAFVQNLDNDVAIKNLGNVLDQLEADFVVMIYKSLRGVEYSNALARVAKQTAKTLRRVQHVMSDLDNIL